MGHLLLKLRKTTTFYVYSGVFIFLALNAFLLTRENYFIMLLPFVLLIAWGALFHLDKFIWVALFLIPVSVPLQELKEGLSVDMNLPSEPLIALILVVFIFKLIYEKKFDRKILTHPVSYAVYFYLGWMLFTSFTSSLPLVSFKYTLARMWFLAAFYFLATQLFVNFNNTKNYIWMYSIPLLIVIGYTVYNLASYGFLEKKVAHQACHPFYKDHTSYGAVLAFLIPPVATLIFLKSNSYITKILSIILLFILTVALILSYTRASWIGVIVAFGIWLAIKFKIRFQLIAFGTFLLALFLWISFPQIEMMIERNKETSSRDLATHFGSISNTRSDPSNRERINRWNCAIRMFEEKPLLGFGPGTYMFKYAPYQVYYEKTIISTNAGNMGNAHSEYLGPLSDSGLFGLLSFLGVIACTIITSVKVIKIQTGDKRLIAIGVMLGLATYYIHGVLNNFLDTDKVSALFWGFTAILVALDVYHKPEEKAV